MFKLVIQDDEGKTTVVPLIRDEIYIGRKEGNTIRLTERNVSRRHARILRNNGEVQIEDLGSYNGIRVNNARIAERVSLRISDQVQIGDYKLYLKAEGVEQVDDARTMPIERIDNAPATEVMNAAVPPASPIPPTPAPQRTQMAVADTDPGGRPVATAAQVAALTAPGGYGKLVVVSSNFAGKEFDLTRPQMIVGRTDENDLVINHRSISRNHAKVIRDTETQRYTISDLQSSNGVRVNGQDYGKVELRRGDVVDLGHVRLRFVEPGEDFVFARDAVIADVPETGGKRGMVIAVVLALVLLGAVAAFFAMKKNDGDKDKGGMVEGSGGGSGSGLVVATGSDQTGSAALVVPSDAPDAAVNTVDNHEAEMKRLVSECGALVTDRKWTDLGLCADNLAAYDPKAADVLRTTMHVENAAEIESGKMQTELSNGSLPKARKHLDAIPAESVYKQEAQAKYDAADKKVTDDFHARAVRLKGKCADIDVLIRQANEQSSKAGDAVRKFKCAEPPDCSSRLFDSHDKTCVKQFCANHGSDSHCSSSNPPPSCDVDALQKAADSSVALGQHAQALRQYEEALRCHYEAHTVQLAFMEACNANIVSKAKVYWKKMSADYQNRALQICVRNHITRDQLEGP